MDVRRSYGWLPAVCFGGAWSRISFSFLYALGPDAPLARWKAAEDCDYSGIRRISRRAFGPSGRSRRSRDGALAGNWIPLDLAYLGSIATRRWSGAPLSLRVS
jgi:hypothetical protein